MEKMKRKNWWIALKRSGSNELKVTTWVEEDFNLKPVIQFTELYNYLKSKQR